MQTNDIKDELSQNFIEYAVACNSDRAIPDAKSGLKPVAKRILWSTYESGFVSSKPHVKSARVVGNTMSSYHPHGDASIYGALVRLSQNWIMRYPLIDLHGNNGNITGDGPADMRYTEVRLSRLTEEGMLAGIKKKNVDFIPNYDETQEEPITLPALFPNLLCNPNSGIGVSIACHWLPHNLTEVTNAIFAYMDGKEPTLPGPDFPTGGVIINKNDIPAIMKTGHGSVKVRGRYKIEKQNIIFYEIPYEVSIETILTEISEACDKKEIEGISEIRDESNKKGIRIVIECESGVSTDKIVKQLFAKTSLQTSISYNQVALIDKTPTELNLKDCIKIYVDHNIECLVKETQYDLQKAKDRQHIVEGLLKALEDIDNIIALIKKSKSSANARDNLISTYHFSEAQAQAIVDMKLGRLAGLEKNELEQENQELLFTIDRCNTLINSQDLQKKELKHRLAGLIAHYADDRRTELTQIDDVEEEIEEEVPPEDVVVIIGCNNDIKKIPQNNFVLQNKRAKGTKGTNEYISDMISTNTSDTLILFTSKGQMYKLPVSEIPTGTADARGVVINSLINLEKNEEVIGATSLYKNSQAKYAVFITKQGRIKKTALEEYFKLKKRSSGLAAIKLKENDSLANVIFMNEEDLILVTKKGMCIHIPTTDITPIGRMTMGVCGIKLNDDDEVLIGLPIHKNTDTLALVTAHGFGKKCNVGEFVLQNRGGKGVAVEDSDDIVGAAMIDNDDKILLSVDYDYLCLSAKDFPLLGRIAKGNELTKGKQVNYIVKIKGDKYV